ncbi:MAG: NAD(P)H-hydrate epimerase [Planctomycetota bacterium]
MFSTITRQQSREIDRRAIEQYGMTGLVLMENAGRGTVDVLCRLAKWEFGGRLGRVVICCGKGNNAGDGFVIARHLDLRGHDVRVLVWADPAELLGDAEANFKILQHTGVPIELFGNRHDAARLAQQLVGVDWIVDALLGTGAHGEPRPPLDEVIGQLNAAAAKRLAVDLPSGLDCDTGVAAQQTIRADETCTFVAMKRGFVTLGAEQYTGRVHVLDIGAPRRLVEDVAGAV